MQSQVVFLGRKPDSKRGRLQAKKAEKEGKLAVLHKKMNELRAASAISVDSEDDISIIPADKPIAIQSSSSEEKQPKSQIQPSNFNQFNYARLAKLPTPVDLDEEEAVGKRGLSEVFVTVDEQGLADSERDAHKAFIFRVEGNKQEKNIRKVVLKSRAALEVISADKKEAQKEEPQKEEPEEQLQEDDDLQDKKGRYFATSFDICYRCGEQGHFARNCLQEWVQKCKYCFSRQHPERSCPQTCFECGNTGHISSECPEDREKCQRCFKRGHLTEYCGVIVKQKADMARLHDLFSDPDLKRLKCINEDKHQEGTKKGFHFNCFDYATPGPFPYHQLRKVPPKDKGLALQDYQLEDRGRSQRYERRKAEDDYRNHSHRDRAHEGRGQTRERERERDRGQSRAQQGRERAIEHYQQRYRVEVSDSRGPARGLWQNRGFSQAYSYGPNHSFDLNGSRGSSSSSKKGYRDWTNY